MKILQVIPVFSASSGGPVTVVRSISKELAKQHEVTVYTTSALDQRHDLKDSSFEVESDGYHVAYFPRVLTFNGFNVSLGMARALKETLSQYDVVHLHSWRHFQDIIVHHYAKKYGVPYVLQVHGSLPRIMAKRRLKWIYDVFYGYRLLRDASKVIAVSAPEVQQYKAVGVSEEKIEVIPNVIDLSEFADMPLKGSFRKKFSLDDEMKILLYLGRLHQTKGLDILLQAFASITEKIEHVKLAIVGPDDGYLRELKYLAKALKIEDNVLIVGPVYGRKKLEAYVDADVCVLPSKYEIWGMTVLEAIACGTPVILTENCGVAEYLKDKVGLVVKYDLNDLCEALLEILLHEDKRKVFKGNCKTVIEDFDVSRIVPKLESVYEHILAPAIKDFN